MMNDVIRTNHLTKSYKKKTAVKSVSLHVKQGEIYGCVGPNGAGKSTIIKIQISQSGPEETSDNFINSSPRKMETSLLILQCLQFSIFKIINIFPLIAEHGILFCDMRLKSEVFFINQFRLITFFYVYPIFTFFLNRVT